MRKAASAGRLTPGLLALALWCAAGALSPAAAVTEEFQVEGLVSPASPKALAAALEERLAVKVVGYQLRDTASGWPVVRVEFEEGAVTRDEIAAVIDDTEDPTGRMFRVHTGPPRLSVALLAEETTADGVLGDPASATASTARATSGSPSLCPTTSSTKACGASRTSPDEPNGRRSGGIAKRATPTRPPVERAVLAGASVQSERSVLSLDDSLDELGSLPGRPARRSSPSSVNASRSAPTPTSDGASSKRSPRRPATAAPTSSSSTTSSPRRSSASSRTRRGSRSSTAPRSSSTSSPSAPRPAKDGSRSSLPSTSTCCPGSRGSGRTSNGSAAASAPAAPARPRSRPTGGSCGAASLG